MNPARADRSQTVHRPDPPPELACQPGICRGHPDCPRHHCNGHPIHDAGAEFDPVARARFWRHYLVAMALAAVAASLWLLD
jgi:hypothetical protein